MRYCNAPLRNSSCEQADYSSAFRLPLVVPVRSRRILLDVYAR